ncbi:MULTISPECIES: hypothetical protein [Hyphomonas]|uniref:Uncharacterized protein n=1 Tax=Hyphomonas adhaerens TaxID=81029 RepID=A0A3B9H2Y5_9PROT|nr:MULTISPECIES: hypothetical protein [Hyphomonas]HAE29053.1 hypothetical protein [Hyphomonas adhaerens]|tara:strand:- start:2887 stop:3096 length:210 start_codon:yes stop_codon:yes gene_type:complete
MSLLKDLITDFLGEMADFAEPRGRRDRPRKGELAPARILTHEDAEAIGRWESEGGRPRHRRSRFDMFDD